MVKFKSINPPRGFHFMKKKGGVYALMQGSYKPHKGAVKKLNLEYRNNIDRNEWIYYINYLKEMINKFTMKKRKRSGKKKKKKKSTKR